MSERRCFVQLLIEIPKAGLFVFNVFFALFFSSFLLKAQDPYIPFQHLSSTDGLSHNQILSILQDKQGFIWAGTVEGLNRFDGYEFTVFHHNRTDSTSLVDDFVNTIVEDKNGTLWLGTAAGLSRYNKATNSFTSYIHDPKNTKSINSGLINHMLEDKKGNFWFALSTGFLDYFDPKKKTFEHYQISKNLVDLTSLLEDKEGNLWIGTHQGIVIMNAAHQVVNTFQHDPSDPTSLSNNSVNSIFQDAEGIIWVGTSKGLNQYSRDQRHFIRYENESNLKVLGAIAIRSLAQDKNGWLWVGTINGGLYIWNKSTNRVYHFSGDGTDSRGISDNSIYSLLRDRNDNMWVGTHTSGINFYDNRRQPFVIYQHMPSVNTSLSNNKVNAVAEQPGKGFWIATDGGGLNFFDEKKNLFKAYRHQANDKQSLPSDFVVDVLWDEKEQCVWVATWGGGLARFDPRTKRFKKFQHDANDSTSIASNQLWRMYQDKEGFLYIGTLGSGLSIYNKQSSKFYNYNTDDGIADENVVSIYKDKTNLLWLGSWGNGVTIIDLANQKILPLPKGLTIKSNESIFGDSLGGVWISGNPGIQYFDKNNDTTYSLTTEQGLPESNINGLVDDKKGNFWLSTNKGIFRLNLESKEFNSFTIEDGLPINQFTPRLLRGSNGKMYFGSVNGLVVFHPDSIKKNDANPSLLLTDLKIFNKSVYVGSSHSVLNQPINETKEIWLPYEYNFITLNYIALNNTLFSRNQYAYKLDGFNDDWVYVGHQRSATYTSLDPGDYTFKVKASNNDGEWKDSSTSLIIHVLPPWWATYWFRIFAIAVMAMMIVAFYRYRLTRIKMQNTKLSILVTERTKELQERQDEIEVQNEELKQSKEEISAQWDIVMDQNVKLEEARATIERQHAETQLQNDNLELEVQSRTKELLEYNQQLEQFAFISAHNLRAPVARILGLGNVLDLNLENPEENKMIYQKMVATAHDLDRVVRDLNTILEIRKNNNAFISEICFKDELALVQLYLQKEMEDTMATILSDFSSISHVYTVKPYFESILQNLLSNAIKYRHPDRAPIIHIATRLVDDYICLTVSDNGMGIDTSLVKDKIFKLYQRFHTHVEGKGLGLYLIKTQIDAVGGIIEMESTLNEGTSFRIYLKNQSSA